MVFAPFIYFLYRTLYGQLVFECPIQTGGYSFCIKKSAYYGIFIQRNLLTANQSRYFILKITNGSGQSVKTRPAFIFIRRSYFNQVLMLDCYVKLDAGDYTLTVIPKHPTSNQCQQFYQIREVVPDFYFALWLLAIYCAAQLILQLIKQQ